MAEKDSKNVFQQKAWFGGISNFLKEPQKVPFQYYYSQCIDTRTDPYALTLHPATQKESGTVVTDLLKFSDTTPASLVTYAIGNTGNFYSRTNAGSWSLITQMASSHGNGLGYFYGDDYVYTTGDTAIGRYGPLSSSPTFTSDFLTAQAGVPQNTYSLALVSASSQSADAADSASLSVTSDITLEAYAYLNTLPAVGSSMTLVGKWDESTNIRSYIMDIYGVSGFFGDSSDSTKTVSVDTTEAPIDSACTGTISTYSLSATNASFAAGQAILIHQTQGSGFGTYQRNKIISYTAGTITLETPLNATYVSGAQVLVMKQYSNVTVNGGVTWSAKAWNGTVGGILAFLASGTVTITGTINATGKGFRGGSGQDKSVSNHTGFFGESPNQAYNTGYRNSGGYVGVASPQYGGGGANEVLDGSGGGAGAAHSSGGQTTFGNAVGASSTYGTNDASQMNLGSGGGGGFTLGGQTIGDGGVGGGIVYICGTSIVNNGSINARGLSDVSGATNPGGAGSGGMVALCAQTATIGTINATGGSGTTGFDGTTYKGGGLGGDGRIALAYLTSYTNTVPATPTLNATQDNTLVTTTSYQLRFGVSNNGTSFEYLTKNLSSLTTAQWNRFAVSWTASSSLATYYLNGITFGTTTGTKTAISDNASLLYIGANKGASVIQNYLNGYIDDVRIWGSVKSAADLATYNNVQLTGSEANLKAYYKLNNAATDSTTNANNLTLRNSPSYTATVPFLDATTRLDIDQSYTTIGSTYTLPTSISEVAADMLPFTPASDPQKSMDVNVDTKGTGDWTITIHDSSNRTIATKTITNANMTSAGWQEFTWATPWRIVIGKSYHAHITVSTGTSKIVSSSLNTLQSASVATGDFHTYFQYLVSDTLFHPVARMLNFMVIGNERYVAKWDGAFYYPNLIAFPPGTHVRCVGYWGKYIAFGTWQETTSGTPNIYDFPTGKIYFWDGISLTFNFSIDIPEGQVNAIYGMDYDLYYVAGYKADLMKYNGGYTNESGNSQGQKVKRNPFLERSKYAEIYPQALTMWGGLLRIGSAANTNSTVIPQGVYTWGTLYPQYAENLTFDYIISTGNKSSTVKIGMLQPVGQKLLVGWQDGTSYGCDVIDPTGSVYYQSGLIQTNIQDGEDIWKNNILMKIRSDHVALAAGEGISVGYKADRAASYSVSNSQTDSVTKKFTTNTISNGRLGEYQLQAMLTGNGTSTPTLLSIAALVDSGNAEQQL